jgi:alpha-L-rhamnosidase
VYDFGAVMVGRIRCRVTGPAGASVRVVSGEQRAADGSVVCDNYLVAGEAQLDTLRLETDVADLEWEPAVRLPRVPLDAGGELDRGRRPSPRCARCRSTPRSRRSGSCPTDEPLIEWIDAATARTFRNNFHGIPTDTPIYEKNGWTADAHLATEGLLHHLDLRAAFGKWIDDHVDAQAPDGSVPQIIPTPGWGRASDPTWSSSAVLIPWYLYREYGDREVLMRVAPMVRRFADQLLGELDGGPWRGRTWGDWLSPAHQVGPEGMAPIGTVMAVTDAAARRGDPRARSARTPSPTTTPRGAHRRGLPRGPTSTRTLAPTRCRASSYRQALNILPLAFGVVPDADVPSVRASLVDDLEHRTAVTSTAAPSGCGTCCRCSATPAGTTSRSPSSPGAASRAGAPGSRRARPRCWSRGTPTRARGTTTSSGPCPPGSSSASAGCG